jgi:protein-histidine pros-kinase
MITTPFNFTTVLIDLAVSESHIIPQLLNQPHRQGIFFRPTQPLSGEQLPLQFRLTMEKFDTHSPLRQSEAGYHNLLECLSDPVIIVGVNHRILLVNRQFEMMFGYNRSEVIGKTVEMLIPELFPHHRDYLGEYRLNPEIRSMRYTGDVFALRKGGSEFPIDIHLSPIETV